MRLLAAIFISVIALVSTSPATAAPAFPEQIDLPAGFQPEGIAVGRGDTFYTGAIFTGAIYSGSLRTGEGDILVPAQEGRQALGMTVDNRNRLFVAGGFTGDAYVYDAATGEELAYYDFASGTDTVVNDVTVTKTAAWFTDSFRPVLYMVPIAADGTLGTQADVETLALTGDFTIEPGFNLNGIVSTPNGDLLAVVQSNTGELFTVDPETGVTTEIDLAGETVVGGDGLVLHGRTLYVIQNATNEVAKIRLSADFESGAVLSRTTDPGFDFATTAAAFGNSLYVVNARFGIPDPAEAEFWITRIPRP